MNLSKVESEKFFKEISNTKVFVSLSDTQINGYPQFDILSTEVTFVEKKPAELKSKDGKVVGLVEYTYIPFEITINDEFKHDQNSIFYRDNKYVTHLSEFSQAALDEIDSNIKLRLNKWEILDFLTVFKTKLKIIRSVFTELQNNCPGTSEQIYHNSNARICSN